MQILKVCVSVTSAWKRIKILASISNPSLNPQKTICVHATIFVAFIPVFRFLRNQKQWATFHNSVYVFQSFCFPSLFVLIFERTFGVPSYVSALWKAPFFPGFFSTTLCLQSLMRMQSEKGCMRFHIQSRWCGRGRVTLIIAVDSPYQLYKKAPCLIGKS